MDNGTQALLTELIKAIIGVVIPVLVYYVAQALRQHSAELRARLGEVRWFQLISIVEAVVKAAEQNGLKNELENTAEAKRAWAISEAQRILNERGLTGISVETIALMIEAAVREGVQRRPDEIVQPVTQENPNG